MDFQKKFRQAVLCPLACVKKNLSDYQHFLKAISFYCILTALKTVTSYYVSE